jgi:hypothetical protein
MRACVRNQIHQESSSQSAAMFTSCHAGSMNKCWPSNTSSRHHTSSSSSSSSSSHVTRNMQHITGFECVAHTQHNLEHQHKPAVSCYTCLACCCSQTSHMAWQPSGQAGTPGPYPNACCILLHSDHTHVAWQMSLLNILKCIISSNVTILLSLLSLYTYPH